MQRMPDGSFAKARALLVLQAVCGGLAMWAATTLYVVVEDGGLDGTDRARAFSLYGWMRGGPYVVIALLIVGGAAVAMLARRNVSSIALQWDIALLGLYVAMGVPMMFYTQNKVTRVYPRGGDVNALGFTLLFSVAIVSLIVSVRVLEIAHNRRPRATAGLLVLVSVFSVAWIVWQATSSYGTNYSRDCGSLFDHEISSQCVNAAHSLIVESLPVIALGIGAVVVLVLFSRFAGRKSSLIDES